MEKMSTFQTILMIVFGALAVAGMLFFATRSATGPGGSEDVQGNVVVWGTMPEQFIAPVISGIAGQYNSLQVTYEEKSDVTYDVELLEALASGTGPDLFQVNHDKVIKHANKIFIIPYENYEARTFDLNFVDAADVFRNQEGVLAFPATLDPLVLYYNKTLLTAAFELEPPVTWQELADMATRLTVTSEGNNVIRSGFAMGTFRNIEHAKDMLALLFLQSGNQIVTQSATGGYASALSVGIDPDRVIPKAIEFYTAFADPDKSVYMWNAGLPEAQEAFLSEQVAMYIGYASEHDSLLRRNPNLDFGMTLVPQLTDDGNSRKTYAKLNGFAVSRVSANIPGAFVIGNGVASEMFNAPIVDPQGLVSPLRSLVNINEVGLDERQDVVRRSAIISHTWPDPDGQETDRIFEDMISRVRSGAETADQSLTRAHAELGRLLRDLSR